MHLTAHHSTEALDWLVANDPVPIVPWQLRPDEAGYDPRSTYVETYWLSILGPSCVLVSRRLRAWLEAEPQGFELSLSALAESIGVGSGVARSSPIVRTMARLADFGLANITDTYGLRRPFPPLNSRQVSRLPAHLAAAHASEILPTGSSW